MRGSAPIVTAEDGLVSRSGDGRGSGLSRRSAVGLLLGALPLAAAAPVRLAISESLVSDVNISDARAAMSIWLKRMSQELNLEVEVSPKIFDSTEEIVRRARAGLLDSVALNVVEYRQIADVLDSGQIIAENNTSGMEQYLLLARRGGGIQQLGDLKGRRLCVLKASRLCAADAWLATILDAGHFEQSELFFGAVTTESKVSRVVLPVFFGQIDACLSSKRGFDTMCELNPQVAKNLQILAISPPLVLTFYAFHKNYHGSIRDRFAKVYSDLDNSAAGRQLATLFQFNALTEQDASCLASAVKILETADRIRARRGGGGRKG